MIFDLIFQVDRYDCTILYLNSIELCHVLLGVVVEAPNPSPYGYIQFRSNSSSIIYLLHT